MITKPVALITGASAGMGEAAARHFSQAGYEVYAGARRVEKMSHLTRLGIHTLHLDVTNAESNHAFVDRVLADTGRIDVLINNAGYGSFGALEDVTSTEAKRQFEVNVFGAFNLIQLVLPTMRKQHYGKIINNSSTGGQLYSPLGGWYYASKHALEALSDSLRLEVKSFGIDVIIIEPGGTDTNWQQITNEHLLRATPKSSPYRSMAERVVKTTIKGMSTADELGQLMLKVTTIKKPKSRYQVKFIDKLMVIAARKFSYHIMDQIIGISQRILTN
ncbi:oxidoreductase [Lactiplantibacillus paraplantarum]|uniref:oxidoreductase n=1 Tax=Lactiplantibacillus paraplantarum TaxID=60520 RepID=UPI0021A75B87|nr:oxidoreductase [Lactiplantibacillus paraplantarum]